MRPPSGFAGRTDGRKIGIGEQGIESSWAWGKKKAVKPGGLTALKQESIFLRGGYFDYYVVDGKSAECIKGAITYEVEFDPGTLANGFSGDRNGKVRIVGIEDRHIDWNFGSQKGVISNPDEPDCSSVSESVSITESVKRQLGSRDPTEVQWRREE